MASGTRDRLLDAAAAVLLRDGAHALTLEAVAAQAVPCLHVPDEKWNFKAKHRIHDCESMRRSGRK